tara:strand:+ start:62 stop:268 length:207 start_codon:yes stop_codon:yes gene_type:complete
MSGYGIFVWSSFVFTLISFVLLYLIIKSQFIKEKNKFISKFGELKPERAELARSQSINKEILSNSSNL